MIAKEILRTIGLNLANSTPPLIVIIIFSLFLHF